MPEQTSSSWDAGRFVRTLAFFETIPLLGSFSWVRESLERLFPQSSPQPERVETGKIILVVGATGGVGKRVVQRLRSQGYAVRALVRNPSTAQQIPSEGIQLFPGDVTRPETLTADLMEGVVGVISCLGPRVQPVEGDTPDRAKYYQGVKFYQPEVVGDTPEAVEYRGVQNLLAMAKPHLATLPTYGEKMIFDFRSSDSPALQVWGALDDVVMGGVSESTLEWHNGAAAFEGNVSTANSGGFASLRTRNLTPALDLTGYEGIDLRLRGDGQRYKFFLRSDDRWDGVGYAHSFDTVPDLWMTVSIPFNQLVPVFRARTMNDAPGLDLSRICSLQLMLSKFEYDGKLNPRFRAGRFQLQIESIKAYSSKLPPRWIMVSSAGVTRPDRPGLNLEEEPPAVKLNQQLGGILTWKLRAEELVRQSGLPYTIIRPCALTEEPGKQRLRFDQGDNLKGKVSREDIAELCVQALKLPQAHNCTFEVAEGEGGCEPGAWVCLFEQLQPDR